MDDDALVLAMQVIGHTPEDVQGGVSSAIAIVGEIRSASLELSRLSGTASR